MAACNTFGSSEFPYSSCCKQLELEQEEKYPFLLPSQVSGMRKCAVGMQFSAILEPTLLFYFYEEWYGDDMLFNKGSSPHTRKRETMGGGEKIK